MADTPGPDPIQSESKAASATKQSTHPLAVGGAGLAMLIGIGVISYSFFQEVLPNLDDVVTAVKLGACLFFAAAVYFFCSLVWLVLRKTSKRNAVRVDGIDITVRFRLNDAATHVLISVLVILIACMLLTFGMM